MATIRKIIRGCQDASQLLANCTNTCVTPSGGPYLREYDDSIVIATPSDLDTYAADFFAARKHWCYKITNWLGNSSDIPGYSTLCQTIPTDDPGDYIGKIHHCTPINVPPVLGVYHLEWQDQECPGCYDEFLGANSRYGAQVYIDASPGGVEEDPWIRLNLRLISSSPDIFGPPGSALGWDVIWSKQWNLPRTIAELIDTPYCELEILDENLSAAVDPNGDANPDFPFGIDPWCADLGSLQVSLW